MTILSRDIVPVALDVLDRRITAGSVVAHIAGHRRLGGPGIALKRTWSKAPVPECSSRGPRVGAWLPSARIADMF